MTTEPDTTNSCTSRKRAARPRSAAAAPTKSGSVIKLLLRARGATPLELIAATDWQVHSVRAFLSGLRKKGRVLVRELRKGGEFAYRIEATTAEPVPTHEPPTGASEV